MHINHKKRTVKFVVFFIMMFIFAVIEDVLAAKASGAPFIMETLPLIGGIALFFTIVTEYVEERFEPGEQPLEHLIHTLEHLKRKKIPPTYENIKKHLKKRHKDICTAQPPR